MAEGPTSPDVAEVNSSIERIIRDARAADETMQHIRVLFKQESFDKNDVGIPDMLREVVRMVQEDPEKRDVPIECHFEESLPMDSCRPDPNPAGIHQFDHECY